ncbi:MAG: hypothetical protein GC189_02405 [Alphaproteobacteria bacterium]|nr:hypothetical protein [Alphaproteobacteria bacterium]
MTLDAGLTFAALALTILAFLDWRGWSLVRAVCIVIGIYGAGLAMLSALGVPAAAAAAFAGLLVVCVAVFDIDRAHHVIPDTLVLAMIALAFTPIGAAAPLEAIASALALSGLFFGVRQALKRGPEDDPLGLGDVKLAGGMGALLGLQPALLAVAIAGAATLLALTALRVRPAGGSLSGAPFGVALAPACAFMAALQLAPA